MNRSDRMSILLLSLAILILVISFGCSKKEAADTPQAITWMTNLDKGFEMAQADDKPLMIYFMAEWCPTCKKMAATTFLSADVIKKTSHFIPVQIDVDDQGELADQYKCNAGKYGGIGIPNILFLDGEGNELKHPIGYRSAEPFLAVMDSVLTMID